MQSYSVGKRTQNGPCPNEIWTLSNTRILGSIPAGPKQHLDNVSRFAGLTVVLSEPTDKRVTDRLTDTTTVPTLLCR